MEYSDHKYLKLNLTQNKKCLQLLRSTPVKIKSICDYHITHDKDRGYRAAMFLINILLGFLAEK